MLKFFVCLSIVLFLLIGVLIVLIMNNDRTSELTANLPKTTWTEKRSAFRARVKDYFPKNITENELKSQLMLLGFQPKGNFAEFVDQKFIYFCPSTYSISWMPKDDGNVEDIEGYIHHTC